jgi:tetratricopeptide (TPR) repeat protein
VKRARDDGQAPTRRETAWEPEVWTRDAEPTRPEPASRPQRARRPRAIDPEAAGELTAERGEKRGSRLQARLADAAGAFERGRYQDAARILRPLVEEAPGAASVRELNGLALYHLEKWRGATRELEAFRSLTGSVEQHPVLADSYRALKRYKKVDELWEELRSASPGAELVAEGRIVAAGALADRGDVKGAIALIERAKLDLKRPREHHLRLIYALADLYERVGDLPRARELFGRIAERDHGFYDAAARARALR